MRVEDRQAPQLDRRFRRALMRVDVGRVTSDDAEYLVQYGIPTHVTGDSVSGRFCLHAGAVLKSPIHGSTWGYKVLCFQPCDLGASGTPCHPSGRIVTMCYASLAVMLRLITT